MEFIFYFLLFLCSILLIKFLVPSKNKNLPPSPPSLPILGHLPLVQQPIYKSLAKLSKKYGQVMYLKFGSRPVIVVSSPSAVEECLSSKNDIIFANRPRLLIGKLFGHDYTSMVWADYGPNWKNLRRISASELLSPSRLQMLSAMRFDEVKSIIKRLSDQGCKHQNVELTSKFFALTYNVMMRMIAGKRYYGEHVGDSEEAKRFQELVRETLILSDASNVGDFLPIWRWIGGDKGFKNKMLGLKAKRDKFLEDLLEEHRRLRSDLKFDREEKQTPLIQVLLSLQEAEPEHYTDDVVKGIMWVGLPYYTGEKTREENAMTIADLVRWKEGDRYSDYLEPRRWSLKEIQKILGLEKFEMDEVYEFETKVEEDEVVMTYTQLNCRNAIPLSKEIAQLLSYFGLPKKTEKSSENMTKQWQKNSTA